MNNYQAIRNNVIIGDILLTRDIDSPISKVISGVTHGYWSHIILYLGDGKILETNEKGVYIRSLEDYLDGSYDLGLFRIKPPLENKILQKVVQEARKLTGTHYNWLQLFWQFILRLCGKSEDPDFSLDVGPGMICTEVVATAYKRVGIEFKSIPPHQMEPIDFDESSITVRIV